MQLSMDEAIIRGVEFLQSWLFDLWKDNVITLKQKMTLSTSLYNADWRIHPVFSHLQYAYCKQSLEFKQAAQLYFKIFCAVIRLEEKNRRKNPTAEHAWETPDAEIFDRRFEDILDVISLCRKHQIITPKEQEALAWLLFTFDWRLDFIPKKDRLLKLVESKGDELAELTQNLQALARFAKTEAWCQQVASREALVVLKKSQKPQTEHTIKVSTSPRGTPPKEAMQ